MIEFVLLDDDKEILKINMALISIIMMKIKEPYQVKVFEEYGQDFKKIIHSKINQKIYILDLELKNKSGIDIAREIRKYDWKSIIIILTAHSELEMQVLKGRLLILDFISKFDDYKNRLTKTILKIIDIKNKDDILIIKEKEGIMQIPFESILYLLKEKEKNITKIVTYEYNYKTRQTLISLETRLPHYFIRTHRACIVNRKQIQKIYYNENKITFKNNLKLEYISKKHKKGLKVDNFE